MSELLRQVALEQRSARGVMMDVAWIEADLARVGKKLHVEGQEGVWIVAEVYGSRRREFVEASRPARKHFAEVSDG